jgi:LAS superfamily LD-carboxypeptidase LdcB
MSTYGKSLNILLAFIYNYIKEVMSMRNKNKKNDDDKLLLVIIILLGFIIVYLTVITIYEDRKIGVDNETSINNNEGKDVTYDEYVYKEDLLTLGYSHNDVLEIEKSFTKDEVKTYLLEEKYTNLLKFKESKYFNIKNIKRYQLYFDKNEYTEENAVMYVEIGLDNEFYSNIKPADTSKGTLILVNKYYSIDENYDANLETLGDGYGKGKMNKEAAKHFREMVDAAKKDGIKLRSISAYRSYSSQKSIYENYVKKDGQKKADTYSARPGHSEHNTGLAVDINTASTSAHFEKTKEYEWLINNSYKYGFILRYPEDKMFITGYKYEPWHYRYLNVEIATKIHELDVTYEEYLLMNK